jgi:hypothetical protein
MNIIELETSKILPYINNPRKNLNAEKVASSIKEFGFQQPIVLDKENVIIVGHTRFEAAKILGLEKVPVVIADLPKNKAKAYRIADNRLNLDNLGFTNDELDTLLLKDNNNSDELLNPDNLEQTNEFSDIKMVQIFLNPENHEKFNEAIQKIYEKHKIDNISDAVLKAVLNETDSL